MKRIRSESLKKMRTWLILRLETIGKKAPFTKTASLRRYPSRLFAEKMDSWQQWKLTKLSFYMKRSLAENGITDLTEYRMRKVFMESLNENIYQYNYCADIFKHYYKNVISSHMTLARLFGWFDLAEAISKEFICIELNMKPRKIVIN